MIAKMEAMMEQLRASVGGFVQNLPRPINKDKRPTIQEQQAQEYSFSQEKVRALFVAVIGADVDLLPLLNGLQAL